MNFRLRPAGLSPKCDSLPLSFPSTGCGFYAAISSDSCTKHKICIWPNFLMHLDRVCKKLQPWFILSLCLSNLSCLLGSWRHLRPTPPSRCVIFPMLSGGGGGLCKLYRAFPEVKVPFHWRNLCVYWPWIWIHNLPVNGSKAMSLSSWPKNCAHIIEFKHLEANYDFPLFTQFSFVPCRGSFHISIKRARQVLCPSSFLRAALIASAT